MEQKNVHNKEEILGWIKEVINQTSNSVVVFDKVFIYWGIVFVLNSMISIFISLNTINVLSINFIYSISHYIFAVLVCFFIYIYNSRKVSFCGMEKHLMKLWLLVLIIITISPKVSVISQGTGFEAVATSVDNFSILIISLAIGLIITATFTNYRHLTYIGVVYVCISVLYAHFNLPINRELINIISLIIVPANFLYIGFFFRNQKSRKISIK